MTHEIRNKNLEALHHHHPFLYSRLAEHRSADIGSLEQTPSGHPNLLFHRENGTCLKAYDTQDPWADAAEHLKTIPENKGGLVVFLGMGLGYGPAAVFANRQQVDRISIIEPSMDLFTYALEAVDLTALFASAKVDFFIGEMDWDDFERRIFNIVTAGDTYLLYHANSFSWRPEIYKKLQQDAFTRINQLNIVGATAFKYGETFINNRLANLGLARHSRNLEVLHDRFQGVPAILVSSGPSLSRSMNDLKQARGKCILIAVDGALAPLLAAGIMPDFVASIDINEFSLEKLAPFLHKEWPFGLVCNYKVAPNIPAQMNCANLFFAKEDDPSSAWIDEATGARINVPQLSSVAHLSLAVALMTGADPIVFVGQDLAYPKEASQHAAGVLNARPAGEKETFSSQDLYGGQVLTDRSLLEIRSRLEEVLAAESLTFINASAAGLPIAGSTVMSLDEVIGRYCRDQVDVRGQLAGLGNEGARDMARLTGVLAGTLAGIEELQQLISKINRLLSRISKDLQKSAKTKSVHDFGGLPAGTRRDLEEFNLINKEVDARSEVWLQVSELTFPFNRESDLLREKNNALKEEGRFLEWLQGEMERIALVYRARSEALAKYAPGLAALKEKLKTEERLLQQKNLVGLAEHYISNRMYGQAVHILRGTETESPSPLTLALLGTALLNQLDFTVSESCFSKAVSSDPGLAARILAAKEEAASHWLRHLKEFGTERPNYGLKWIERVLILGKEGTGAALSGLAELWEQDAAEIETLIASGATAQAQKRLTTWEAYAADNLNWNTLSFHLYTAAGETEKAMEQAALLVEKFPGSADTLAAVSRFFLETGMFSEGITLLRRAVAIDAATAGLWEEIGDLLFEAGDFVNSKACYAECAQALPGRIHLFKKIGDCHMRSGQAAEAREAYGEYAKKSTEQ